MYMCTCNGQHFCTAFQMVNVPPIVHSELAVNSPLTNRNTKQDLPTPVSPVGKMCTFKQASDQSPT